jgi:hypothetical protein
MLIVLAGATACSNAVRSRVYECALSSGKKHWFKRRNAMPIKKLILIVPALIAFNCMATAQDPTQDQPKTNIQHVTVKPTSPASGKEMYTSSCAVCHGTDGKGGGLPPVR